MNTKGDSPPPESEGTPEHGRIGFVGTRIHGTDGVSLEADKWAETLAKQGYTCYFMGGELDTPEDRSYVAEKAHFKHPEIESVQERCFGVETRSRETTDQIQSLKNELKEHIYQFIGRFNLDLLIAENALSIPMNLPLGLALTEVIAETGIPAIGHHHDFYWERQRFLVNCVWDYINMAFPPHLPCLQHVTINSSGEHQLCVRCGISGSVIPNVIDFENPPPPVDDYAADVREAFGVDDSVFVLQPTRVVARKGIERAVELVQRLDRRAKLVISHASGDEGEEYERRLREYSRLMNVETEFVSECISDRRGRDENGNKIYALSDVYPHADLVTYPSGFEGFGNAFLETIYYKRPIVVNTYSVYLIDIRPKGFKAIEIPSFVTENTVQQTQEILADEALRRDMVEHNYELGRKYFSYHVLERKLRSLVHAALGA